MFPFRALLAVLIFCLTLTSSTWAEEPLIIASGAGYKRLVKEACTAFTAKTGIQVQQVFGNMGQIVPQAKESGNFDFLLGDERHLGATGLAFSGTYGIGRGKLVVAVAKGSKVTSLEQITDPAVTRVAMPDANKAIYGHAASEYLTNKGIWKTLQPKLLIVGTVPQVTAYVVSGEVDMGFINLTEAMAIESKVAKLIPVDEHLYSPIEIVAKRLAESPHNSASAAFIDFLQSDAAKTLAKKHGL